MQKSLEGRLQTILYHILHTCPDAVPILCPKRWSAPHQTSGIDLVTTWNLAELKISLVAFRNQSKVVASFLFHVDGLDEYYGGDWDVIELLQEMSTYPPVKICLSSRPWNCSEDTFGRNNPHVLRLHELTRKDIELFTHDSLVSYSRCTISGPEFFENTVQEISNRAQGVFLWVRLVVRSLREGIINEDPISILDERLKAIRTDLEAFLDQILGLVETVYRSRMATTFLAALGTLVPLNMMQHYFLE